MSARTPFYVTTAIAYPNAAPHIGFALELLYADVIARFQRFLGKDVIFLTGTDEHGQKIFLKAAEQGKAPQAFTDEMSQLFRNLAKRLNVSHTDFIRTTEERHARAVEKFWKRVDANGFLFKKAYRGLYCVGCEAFKTEKDLVDGLCVEHHAAPKELEEENYFFKLSAFREKLRELYRNRPDFVVPETKFNEAKQLVEGGLEDVSVSRAREHVSWGIAVPGDASQVIYVWFDALVNYLTAIGFGEDSKVKSQKSESLKVENQSIKSNIEIYWSANVHVIGKEINRFHSVLWPAMLFAAGLEPPRQIAVHGWITAEGHKMSKSLMNVIDPHDLLDAFGVDATRYLLLSQIPFSGDGDYSHARFLHLYESDLANDLGNLVHRVGGMVQQYRACCVPDARGESWQVVTDAWSEYRNAMEGYRFQEALGVAWSIVRAANQYVDQEKPWVLAKAGDSAHLDAVLYRLLETIRHVAWLIRPFMPETSDRVLDRLSVPRTRDEATLDTVSAWGLLEAGREIKVGEPLFPRLI